MKKNINILFQPQEYTKLHKEYPKNTALFYRINNDMLVKAKCSWYVEDSLMGIAQNDFKIVKNLKNILDDIIYEYNKNSFKGIFIDIKTQEATTFIQKLDEICKIRKIKLYVPMQFAKVVSHATIIIDTAISGGDIKNILEYALLEHDKIATKIYYTAREFEIPSKDTSGKLIDGEIDLSDKNIFFSQSLCTNYFTNMRGNKCIFTIFDNYKALEEKISIIRQMDIEDIFLSYDDLQRYEKLK